MVRCRGAQAPAPRLAGGIAQRDRALAAQSALASFLPLTTIGPTSERGAGPDRLREVLVPLQGLALPAETWERDVLPRRLGAYFAGVARRALPSAGSSCGVGGAARPLRAGGAVFPRGAAPRSARSRLARSDPAVRRRTRPSARHAACALAGGALLLHGPAGRVRSLRRGHARGAVRPRVGGRGDERLVGAAARTGLGARPLLERCSVRERGSGGGLAASSQRRGDALPRALRAARGRPGIGAPAGSLVGSGPSRSFQHSCDPIERRRSFCSSATACSPASWCWPSASRAGWRVCMRRRPGDARRPPWLLRRGTRWRPAFSRSPARSSACARSTRADRARRRRPRPTLWRRAALRPPRPRAAVPRAFRCHVRARPRPARAVCRARRSRSDRARRPDRQSPFSSDQQVRAALVVLAQSVRAVQWGGLRWSGSTLTGGRSPWETLLAEFGFRAGPRRLTLSA